MFRRFNKLIKFNPAIKLIQRGCDRLSKPFGRRLSSNSAQVAVVLIVVIAIALVFYAVTLNLGKITQTKTQITIASNVGASLLGSQMASYGQQKYMVELGGRKKRCGFTLLGKILLFGVLVVLAVFTFGISLSLTTVVVLSVMAAGSIAIDLAVIEPGINDLWNKHAQFSLDQTSGVLEAGLRTALQTAVSDNKRVIDEFDIDIDGQFGGTTASPNDEINRFAFYYNERIKSAQGPSALVVQQFLDALQELLYDNGDGWGLYDPVGCDFGCCYTPGSPSPTECNRCCYPQNVTDPGTGNSVPVRDPCCDRPFGACGVSTTCDSWSPGTRFPGISPFGGTHPWAYDAWYENPTNAFLSLREQLGRDDEHIDFNKDLDNIGLDPVEQFPATISEFAIEDTTGYLNYDPLFGGTGFGIPGFDPRAGIFPFFYKIRDWAVDLTQAPTPPDTVNFPEHCYWFDYGPFATNVCKTSNIVYNSADPVPIEPRELLQPGVQLILPNDPNDPFEILYNTTERVDEVNVGGVLLVPDQITVPEYIVSENIDPDYCAQYTLYPAPQPTEGFWKSGGDKFCSGTWPYNEECAKAGGAITLSPDGPCTDPDSSSPTGTIPRGCDCGEPGAGAATMWPDDALDELIYILPEFLEWAESILPIPAQTLAKDLIQWYPEAAEWIERGIVSGAVPGVDCYECNQEDGYLWQFLFNMQQMRNRLQNWLDESYAAASCNEVWCAPEASLSCPTVQPDEQAIMGDSTITDIIACLQYNENNDLRFAACRDACLDAVKSDPSDPNSRFPLGRTQDYINFNNACGDNVNTWLPRSLVPGFDPAGNLVMADMIELTPYTDCPDSCNDCLNTCTGLNSDCLDTCLNARTSCAAACGGNAACISNCDTVYNQCLAAQCGPAFTACQNACTCDINGTTYQCTDPNLLELLNNDAEAYKGSCLLENFSAAPRWGTCEANGGLSPMLPAGCPGGGYFDLIEQSIPEAENQAAKFQHRREFLEARVNEVTHIISNVLDPAIAQLDAFLTGPADALVQERIAFDGEMLPYEVIYGWQSDPPPRGGRGLWHMVKVEARVPTRCDDACDPSQTRYQKWTSTDTYRRALGTQRCYELRNTDGVVKIRVTRYDENRPSNALFFPNNLRIWDFRSHPDRSDLLGPDSPVNIELRGCAPYGGIGGPYEGAFLVNGPGWPSALPSDGNACWTEANRFLSNFGVVSETCAQYYHHGGARDGFDFRFVPCRPW